MEEGGIIGGRMIGAYVTEGVIMVSFLMGYQWCHLFEMMWEMEANF